jgi:hypothetical protein
MLDGTTLAELETCGFDLCIDIFLKIMHKKFDHINRIPEGRRHM